MEVTFFWKHYYLNAMCKTAVDRPHLLVCPCICFNPPKMRI